jgi:hypothetical protein
MLCMPCRHTFPGLQHHLSLQALKGVCTALIPQVPQFLLDEAVAAGRGGGCSIVCTQPRRIAAISVAERVASERGERPPGSPGARVGCAHASADPCPPPPLYCFIP